MLLYVWLVLSLGTLALMCGLALNAFSQRGAWTAFRARGLSLWELVISSLIGSMLFPILWVYLYRRIKEARRCRE